MIADFLVPMAAVGIAELGDKTQLSVLLLASRTKSHSMLLVGVMLAFLIVDGAAILLGSWITGIVPALYLKIVSGALFVAFGLLMLFEKGMYEPERAKSGSPLAAGFMMIFLTEWGDKTQLASGLLATQYNGLAVLSGTMVSLFALSAMAIYLGKHAMKKIRPKTVSKVAGVAFVVIGLSFFLL